MVSLYEDRFYTDAPMSRVPVYSAPMSRAKPVQLGGGAAVAVAAAKYAPRVLSWAKNIFVGGGWKGFAKRAVGYGGAQTAITGELPTSSWRQFLSFASFSASPTAALIGATSGVYKLGKEKYKEFFTPAGYYGTQPTAKEMGLSMSIADPTQRGAPPAPIAPDTPIAPDIPYTPPGWQEGEGGNVIFEAPPMQQMQPPSISLPGINIMGGFGGGGMTDAAIMALLLGGGYLLGKRKRKKRKYKKRRRR